MRLVVIPTDPVEAYEQAGYTRLDSYFNPGRFFDEVIAISPLERRERVAFGMRILPVHWNHTRSALRRLQPDVVRAYGGYWPAELAVSARLPDVPVVVSLHDNRPETVTPLVRKADLVLCVSNAVMNLALNRGILPQKLRPFMNRVDRTIHKPMDERTARETITGRFQPGRYILHLGRRVHQKNPDTLIRALALLPPDYRVIFVGQGDPAPYLPLATRLHVESRCHWISRIPNDELPAWFNGCACLCTPSRHEGFGIIFIEAAACGAAIVTSDIPPMNEYLRTDESACLVRNYESPDAIAAAIRRVTEDTTYRQHIRAGALKAAEPFDRERVETLEMQYYREALAMYRPTPDVTERASLYLAGWAAFGRWTSRRLVGRLRLAARQTGALFTGK